MVGYVFQWHNNDAPTDKAFDTADEAIEYAEELLNQIDNHGSLKSSDRFQVVEIQCTNEEWESLLDEDGEVIVDDLITEVIKDYIE